MSIEQTLERIATALEAIAAKAAKAEAPKAEAPKAEAPKAEAPKAEAPAKPERKRTPAKQEEQAALPLGEEAPAVEVLDYDILKRTILEVGGFSDEGREYVMSLLKDYGVKNAQQVPPEAREEMHNKLTEKLTQLQNADEEFV